MLTTQEFKIAKLNRDKAVKMFRIRTRRVGNVDAEQVVDQFMHDPKFLPHRAKLRTQIFLGRFWANVVGFLALLGVILGFFFYTAWVLGFFALGFGLFVSIVLVRAIILLTLGGSSR